MCLVRHKVTAGDSVFAGKFWLLMIVAVGLSACGRSGSSEEVSIPSSGGDVWEVDGRAGRAAMPGAVAAYVNGLHVIVVDDGKVYAGMTPLRTELTPGGGLTMKLAGGLEATLVPAGADQMELRFSSGESVAMRKRQVRQGADR